MNYFSLVKIWVKAGPGTVVAFDAPEIKVMKRGINKSSTHTISKAPGISPIEFKMVIDFLHKLTPPPYVFISSLILHTGEAKQYCPNWTLDLYFASCVTV